MHLGLPVLALILSRVMKHRERMEMLRHGMIPPPDGRWNRKPRLDDAAAHVDPGPGAMPPPQPQSYIPYEDPSSAQCTMRRGLMTTAVGFALLIGLSFIGYHGGDGMLSPASIRPGPWLLGGLIPMFVGVAQMIIALMSGATFPFGAQPPTARTHRRPRRRASAGTGRLRRSRARPGRATKSWRGRCPRPTANEWTRSANPSPKPPRIKKGASRLSDSLLSISRFCVTPLAASNDRHRPTARGTRADEISVFRAVVNAVARS